MNTGSPIFPGLRISVLGVYVFCNGCDLKLFKEPSTFGEASVNYPSPAVCSWIIPQILACQLKLSFKLMHL